MLEQNANESLAKFADGSISKTQQAADATNAFLRSGVDTVLETSQQLRHGAQEVSTKTVNYIRDEPVKSVLMAAATGAVLMALFSLVRRAPARL